MFFRAPIYLLATFWSALVVAGTFFEVAPEVRFLMGGMFGLSLLWPTGALALFLFSLGMVGGDGPGKLLTVFFYEIFSAHLLGLLLRLAIHQDQAGISGHKIKDHPVAFLLVLFVVSGILSLAGLPHEDLVAEWEHIEYQRMSQFIGSREFNPLMPFLDVLYQIQGLALFFLIADYPKAFRGNPKVWALSLLSGSLVILGAGLLEFYGFIALRSLPFLGRLLYPMGFDRLQSFFGNPTWYAEYLTVIAPYSMVLLLLDLPKKIRLSLVIMILIVTEVSLILTMSRGGWLSYPLTLIAMWVAYYTLIKEKEEEKPRRSVIRNLIKKIGISIPITLAVSLSIVSYLNSIPRENAGGTNGPNTEAYLARAQEMKNANERLRYVYPMKVLLAEHPILGGGLNSWGYRLIQEYLKPDGGHFGADMNFGLGGRIEYGSAHNLYFQTLAGKGVIGLLILLGLMGTTVVLAARNALHGHKGHLTNAQKMLSMMVLAYAFAFLIYGNVQEDFYVPALTILFFVTFGIFVQAVPPSFHLPQKLQRALGFLLVLAFGAHVYWEFGNPGVTRIADSQNEFGCYDDLGETPESTEVWCGKRFRVKRPIVMINGEPHAFMRLVYGQGDANHTGLSLKVSADGTPIPPITIPRAIPVWVDITLPVTQEAGEVRLLFEAMETFVPARDYLSGSGDIRQLAVQKAYDKLPTVFLHPKTSDCTTAPQWGGVIWLGCQRGGTLPLDSNVKNSEKVAISLPWTSVSGDQAVWILLEEAPMHFRMIRLPDSRWHSFSELGISLNSEKPLSLVVMTNYPANSEALPFALSIKP